MESSVAGVVHGNLISVERALPEFEGRRVRVVLELEESTDASLPAAEQARLWREWAEGEPDGPIEDEDTGIP